MAKSKKPKHIAVAGNIGAGKTTLTELLSKHYKWIPHFEDVEHNPYLNDFYEDMLKQSIYYGAPLLCESNKPGLMRYFDNAGYGRFIMNRPVETMTRKDKAANKEVEGIAASEVTIGQYFSAISSYVYNYHNAIKFKAIINQLLSMNRNNVTKHDLGVALGWCLLAVNADLPSYKDRYTETQETPTWFQYTQN